jgi:undecaprenyl-diphosphatase
VRSRLDKFSFPSGHTLHAVAFAVVFSWHFPLIGVALVPLVLLIALSRVALGCTIRAM